MRLRWLSLIQHHLVMVPFLTLVLLTVGVAGYMVLQDYVFIDALYMTVITLSTVGFGEVKPLDQAGRIFTVFLIILGAVFVAYNVNLLARILLDGQLVALYRRRTLSKRLEAMNGHYIVCGHGQMGQIVAQELCRANLAVVVIEKDAGVLQKVEESAITHVSADATEEETLLMAGVQRARGLVSVVSRDTDNVFIVLTARDLNRNLHILARAGTAGAEKRLVKAGANRVVSPYASGAMRIAHNILRPTVTDFLELALSGEGMELSMEEMEIPDGSALDEKDLMSSGIRSQFNLIIVAIKRRDEQMVYNPSPQEVLRAGDILIAIGPQENLALFRTSLHGHSLPGARSCKC
jgi:voltage-gated potassium channel